MNDSLPAGESRPEPSPDAQPSPEVLLRQEIIALRAEIADLRRVQAAQGETLSDIARAS